MFVVRCVAYHASADYQPLESFSFRMSVATIERPEHAHPTSAVHIFLPRNLVKCSICYAKVSLSVCLSVCPFVCHTRELRLKGSSYRNNVLHHTIDGRF